MQKVRRSFEEMEKSLAGVQEGYTREIWSQNINTPFSLVYNLLLPSYLYSPYFSPLSSHIFLPLVANKVCLAAFSTGKKECHTRATLELRLALKKTNSRKKQSHTKQLLYLGKFCFFNLAIISTSTEHSPLCTFTLLYPSPCLFLHSLLLQVL